MVLGVVLGFNLVGHHAVGERSLLRREQRRNLCQKRHSSCQAKLCCKKQTLTHKFHLEFPFTSKTRASSPPSVLHTTNLPPRTCPLAPSPTPLRPFRTPGLSPSPFSPPHTPNFPPH